MSLRVQSRSGTTNLWIVGTVAGRRIRESTGTDNPKLAEERRAAREAEIYRASIYGEQQPAVTFAAAVVSYLNTEPRSESTKRRLSRLLHHFGPKLTCAEVDQTRLDQAAEALLRPNSKPATRLREIITPASAVLQHAAFRKWCNPPVFQRGKASPPRTEWLTPREATRLLDAAAPHLRPLLTFLFATGARLGEALALDWRDVDLEHSRAVLRETKNGRDRIVDLCPRALAAMAGLTHCGGVVFRRRDGDPYADRQGLGGGHVKTAWAGALRRSGVAKAVTPHSCRHTWASWHYAQHRDLLLLKRDGGWQSVGLVERYAHFGATRDGR